MADYLISYDLRNASAQEYDNLEADFAILNAERIQESVWKINDRRGKYDTCEELVGDVEVFIDRKRGHRLIVVEFVDSAGFNNLGSERTS